MASYTRAFVTTRTYRVPAGTSKSRLVRGCLRNPPPCCNGQEGGSGGAGGDGIDFNPDEVPNTSIYCGTVANSDPFSSRVNIPAAMRKSSVVVRGWELLAENCHELNREQGCCQLFETMIGDTLCDHFSTYCNDPTFPDRFAAVSTWRVRYAEHTAVNFDCSYTDPGTGATLYGTLLTTTPEGEFIGPVDPGSPGAVECSLPGLVTSHVIRTNVPPARCSYALGSEPVDIGACIRMLPDCAFEVFIGVTAAPCLCGTAVYVGGPGGVFLTSLIDFDCDNLKYTFMYPFHGHPIITVEPYS